MVGMPVAGYLIGRIIDHQWSGTISWAMTLMFLGLVLGSVNVWFWIKRPR